MEELRRRLEGLDLSGGGVVLVRGEAGIGKSSLVSEFIAQTADLAHTLSGGRDDLLIATGSSSRSVPCRTMSLPSS
ncbi:MAG: ATP-binding protein [Acidobacteria bacterium]|nr:ATP-binding protein [Acidobacteriota bacterium]